MNPCRYHLTLSARGRPVMHGWWNREDVAREKFTVTVGEFGALPGTQVTLGDCETGETLASWPDET